MEQDLAKNLQEALYAYLMNKLSELDDWFTEMSQYEGLVVIGDGDCDDFCTLIAGVLMEHGWLPDGTRVGYSGKTMMTAVAS